MLYFKNKTIEINKAGNIEAKEVKNQQQITLNFKGQMTNAWDARNQVAADFLYKKRQVIADLLEVEWLLEEVKDYDTFINLAKKDEELIKKQG